MSDPVEAYYNQSPLNEWNRLFINPYRRVEYEVVLYFLNEHLPPNGRVLDLGGGPGRYTIALAKQGYRMTLADLSKGNIDLAKKKIQSMALSDRVERCVVLNATNLKPLGDDKFDAVLCMGPLYHLPGLEDRLLCLKHCYSVMKADAPLFFTLLPRCTYLRDALRSGAFDDLVKGHLPALEEIFEQGVSHASEVPNTYFCTPDEIQSWFEETHFKLIQLASSHGFAAFMDNQVNRIGRNAEVWNAFIKLVLATCTDPASFSAAEHLVGVARKQSPNGVKT